MILGLMASSNRSWKGKLKTHVEGGVDLVPNREFNFRESANGVALNGLRLYTPAYSFSLAGPIAPYEQIPPILDFTLIESSVQNLAIPDPKWAEPILGEQVFAIGNASTLGFVVSGGCVEKIGKTGIFRISAPSYPGMSGGPVINSYGRIVGMLVRGNEVSHEGVAISLRTIRTQFTDAMSDSRLKDYLLQTELPKLTDF